MKLRMKLGLVLWLFCLTLGTAWGGTTYYVDGTVTPPHYHYLDALRQAAEDGNITFDTGDKIEFSLAYDSSLTAPFEFTDKNITFTFTGTGADTGTISPRASGNRFATLTSGVLTLDTGAANKELTFIGFSIIGSTQGGVVNATNPTGNAQITVGSTGIVNFLNNHAGDYGGALYAYSDNGTASVTLGDSGTYGGTGTDQGNTADRSGGLIYATGNTSASVTIGSGSNFYCNTAGSSTDVDGGGAIYAISFGTNEITTVKVGAEASGTVGTVQGNKATVANSKGGFIYAYSTNGSTNVTLGDSGTYGHDNNATLGNTAGGSGGLIYAWGSTNATVTIGSGSSFYHNSASSDNGGAIYATSSGVNGTTEVKVGAEAGGAVGTVQGNKAGYGSGGFIFANSAGGTTNVTLGAGGTYGDANGGTLGNTANLNGGLIYANSTTGTGVTIGSGSSFYRNSAGNSGGVIYTNGSVNLSGNTLFQDNQAGSRLNSGGGAIYLTGSITNPSTLDLDTDAGDIAFSGNLAGITGNQVANSVFLQQNTGINLHGSHNVFFDDPISHDATVTGNNKLDVNLTGTGSFVQFLGDSATNFNRLNPAGKSGGAVTVTRGSFRLAGANAKFQTQGAAATFTVAATASLAGSGTLEAEQGFSLQSATLTPDSATFTPGAYVNHVFAAPDTSIHDSEKIGTLSLTGNANFDGAKFLVDLGSSTADLIAVSGNVTYSVTPNTVDIGTWFNNPTGVIILSGTGANLATGFNPIVTVGGQPLSGRQSASLDFSTANAVKLITFNANTTLTWTGDVNNNWTNSNLVDANWTDNPGGIPNTTYFQNGDNVTFDATAPADKRNVQVDPAGVISGDITIAAGAYNFTGGQIQAQANSQTGATGKVDVQAGASLGLVVGNVPALTAADTVDFPSTGSLNLTGYTGGDTFTTPPQTVITTANGVLNFNPNVAVAGQSTVDYLTATAQLANGNKDVQVTTELRWYSTNPLRPAHGDFTLAGAANSFTLATPLADNSASTNLDPNWDGKSLTKKGDGTLVLTGQNTTPGAFRQQAGNVALTQQWAGDYQQSAAAGSLTTGAATAILGNATLTDVYPGGDGTQGTLTVGSLNLANATLHLDLFAGNLSDRIHSNGPVTVAGSNILDLSRTGFVDGSYTLLTGATAWTQSMLDSFSIQPGLAGTRITPTLAAGGPGNTSLLLTVQTDGNRVLHWTGSNAGATDPVWYAQDPFQTNWSHAANGTAPDYFAVGDFVNFTADPFVKTRAVQVAADVAVAGLAVTGGQYTFQGPGQIASTSVSTLPASDITERLDLAGSGTHATFQNAGGLAFTQGIAVGSGATVEFGNGFAAATGNRLESAVSGSGDLLKSGASDLILTAANPYTGRTVVEGGTLKLSGDGALAGTSALILQNGSQFDFSAANANSQTFPRLEVTDPGARLNAGAKTLDLSGKVLAFDIENVRAGAVMLSVSGNPLILGNTTLSLAGLPAPLDVGDSITLVAGATGSFAEQLYRLSDRSAYIARLTEPGLHLTYDGLYTYEKYLEEAFAAAGVDNENIHQGLGFLDDLFADGLAQTDPAFARQLDSLFDYVRGLAQTDPASAALLTEQLVGGAARYASTALGETSRQFTATWKNQLQTFLMENLIFRDLLQPMTVASASSSTANASLLYGARDCVPSGKSRIWAGGLATWAKQDPAANLAGYKYDSQGVALGFEHQFNNTFAIGLAAAYSRGDLEVQPLRYENKPDILNVALYAAYAHPCGFFLQGGLGYGHAWNRYDIAMVGFRGVQKEGKYGSDDFAANLELGYVARLPQDFNLIPSVMVEYHHLRNSGWTEKVTGSALVPANRFASARDDNLSFPVGVRFNKLFRIGCGGYVMPEVRAAFVPVAKQSRPFVQAGYAGLNGAATMQGVNPGNSYWRIGAGLSGRINEKVDFRVDYNFDTRSGYREHNLAASVGLSF